MLKPFLILVFGLLLFNSLKAQKIQSEHIPADKDSVLYYIKEPGIIVDNKKDADYILLVMPADKYLPGAFCGNAESGKGILGPDHG